MTNYTFAQLCAEYQAAYREISRLLFLPHEYRSDEHPALLQRQVEREAALKAEMQRRLEDGR